MPITDMLQSWQVVVQFGESETGDELHDLCVDVDVYHTVWAVLGIPEIHNNLGHSIIKTKLNL